MATLTPLPTSLRHLEPVSSPQRDRSPSRAAGVPARGDGEELAAYRARIASDALASAAPTPRVQAARQEARGRLVLRRRLLSLAVALAVAGAVVVGVAFFGAADVEADDGTGVFVGEPTTYVIQPGDTMWSIAETVAPGADPRPVVDRLVESNGSALLLVGHQLIIPGDITGTAPGTD